MDTKTVFDSSRSMKQSSHFVCLFYSEYHASLIAHLNFNIIIQRFSFTYTWSVSSYFLKVLICPAFVCCRAEIEHQAYCRMATQKGILMEDTDEEWAEQGKENDENVTSKSNIQT